MDQIEKSRLFKHFVWIATGLFCPKMVIIHYINLQPRWDWSRPFTNEKQHLPVARQMLRHRLVVRLGSALRTGS
jgi:hypothetical protein